MHREQQPLLKSKSMWRVGTPAAIESESSLGTAAVVFEDDGETGYLYAVDRSTNARDLSGNRTYRIVDAVHIYDATEPQSKPVMAELLWSANGKCAALKLGAEILAVIDFAEKRAWCRSGFGAPSQESGGWHADHSWDANALARIEA
jgi:hypothetical protein